MQALLDEIKRLEYQENEAAAEVRRYEAYSGGKEPNRFNPLFVGWLDRKVALERVQKELSVLRKQAEAHKTQIELHYSTGGHGGPYFGEQDAIEQAKLLLNGCKSWQWIALRQGVNGPLIATVWRDDDLGFRVTRANTNPTNLTVTES